MKQRKLAVFIWILICIFVVNQPMGVQAANEVSSTNNIQMLDDINIEDEQTESSNVFATGYHKPNVTSIPITNPSESLYQPSYARNAGRNYWSKYGSDYYYKQMTANQKALYDALYQMCMDYLTGNADITGRGSVYGATSAYTPGIAYYNLTDAEATNTAIAFVNSNPQFYFLAGEDYVRGYKPGVDNEGEIFIDVYDDVENGLVRAEYTEAFQERLDNWMAQINEIGRASCRERV